MTNLPLKQKIKLVADFIALGLYAIHSDNYAIFKDTSAGKYRLWNIGDGDLDLEFNDPLEAAEKFLEITVNDRIVKTDDEIDAEFFGNINEDNKRGMSDLCWLPPSEQV
jgi:hypothetical protein